MPARRTSVRTISLTARSLGYTARGVLTGLRGAGRTGRWLARRALVVRDRGGAGEVGMIRLFDLHAASCAGDTLVTLGLAGTVFFTVPTDEARGRVALYLLITMAPFALLAPVIGPLLDHFRHGRRYALAVTMLGRAFLAWIISDHLHGFGLYPAAFGVLVLSRAYGVARSAAVPRVLPAGLGLSEAGARASVFGTLAGAAVTPIGATAIAFGPQWALRVASVVFVIGMVIALRLPPRADSDPPEVLPRLLTLLRRPRPARALTGGLVYATLAGSATLRALYGFLALSLAFAIRSGTLDGRVAGIHPGRAGALGLVAGALATGSFLATAAGTRMRIRRPATLQAVSLAAVAAVATATALRYTLGWVVLLCVVTAAASGLAKLAVDATIQERVAENVRASAFAHSETLLTLAWVAGGALGLIPVTGRLGLAFAALAALLGVVRAVLAVRSLRGATLRSAVAPGTADLLPGGSGGTGPGGRPGGMGRRPDGMGGTGGTGPAGRPAGMGGRPRTGVAGQATGEPDAGTRRDGPHTVPGSAGRSRPAASPAGDPRPAGTSTADVRAAGPDAPIDPYPGGPDDDTDAPRFHIYRPTRPRREPPEPGPDTGTGDR